jgi:hypothetical protein
LLVHQNVLGQPGITLDRAHRPTSPVLYDGSQYLSDEKFCADVWWNSLVRASTNIVRLYCTRILTPRYPDWYVPSCAVSAQIVRATLLAIATTVTFLADASLIHLTTRAALCCA